MKWLCARMTASTSSVTVRDRSNCSNPAAWNGLREAWMQGRGTTIMNPRDGPSANPGYTSTISPSISAKSPGKPNGWRVLTYGDGHGPFANDFGLAVRQVARRQQITRKSEPCSAAAAGASCSATRG